MDFFSNMRKEDIISSDLIGGGIPDLEDEIAKLQSGNSVEANDNYIGFEEPDEDFEEDEEDYDE